MNTKDSAKQALAVLIGTDEPCVGKAVEITMSLTFGNEREVRCTVKPDGLEIRKAVSLYDFDVVILFINTMMLIGSVGNKFEQTVELIQELKKTTRAAVIVGTTYHPKGFLTQAEQAGADGLIELPYTLAAMKETIQNAFEGLRLKAEAEAKAALIKQKRDALHPRVVLLDDESSVLELLSRIVWG